MTRAVLSEPVVDVQPSAAPLPAIEDPSAPAVGQPSAGDERLFTRDFWLVVAGSSGAWFAHSMAQWAIAPMLVGLGFDPALGGLGLAVLGASALASRLVAGPRIDRGGGRRTAVVGTALIAAAGLVYTLAALLPAGTTGALAAAILGAALQGIGFGAMTTASLAVVDAVLPRRRRGEGVGYFGASQPIVQGLGATASFAVMGAVGFGGLFLAVAASAAVTTLAFAALRAPSTPSRAAPHRRARLHIDGTILVPILVCVTMSFVGGGLILAIPLLGTTVGVDNPGIFYLASAVLGVTARLATGRASDRLGRVVVAATGFAVMAVAIVGLSLMAGSGMAPFIIGGAVYGVGSATALPAIQALVLDRSPADRRGSASAAMGMAFDVGFMVGSTLIGAVASLAAPVVAVMATALGPFAAITLLAGERRRQAGTA